MPRRRLITDPYFSQTVLPGKGRLRGPNRGALGAGTYRAPRSALQPGAVTRREWLRFMSHVTITNDMCLCSGSPHRHWLWHGSLGTNGYAYFGWRGRNYAAYRFAFIALREAIPHGFEPDHLCRIHACITPACLDIVTKAVNNARGVSVCAENARKTHCVHGHPLEGDNLYAPNLALGHRVCVMCLQAKYARRKAARQAVREALGPVPERTHCQRGHAFTEDNLMPYAWRALGQRVCRTCVRDYQRGHGGRRKPARRK
jgi:hypothetical protein